jgi:hypothetical protein
MPGMQRTYAAAGFGSTARLQVATKSRFLRGSSSSSSPQQQPQQSLMCWLRLHHLQVATKSRFLRGSSSSSSSSSSPQQSLMWTRALPPTETSDLDFWRHHRPAVPGAVQR